MAAGTRLRAGRASWAILAIALGFAALASLLPENTYQRWQLLGGTIHRSARWIYERIHYDPAPIDVAFVGPSRIGAGVSAPQLQAGLAARGITANVVNFSMPETGRNINAAIVDEMFTAKRPKLIVIGVIEKPSRYGHSAFKYVAPRLMIATPAYVGNLNYLSDLIYLPYRQLRLFAADLWPAAIGLDKDFDPSRYKGSNPESTGDVTMPDGSIKNASVPASAAELERGVTKLRRQTNPPILGAGMADVEFGDERVYIRRIVATARAHGTRVAFLALPYYTGPSVLQEQAFYDRYGPTWNAGAMAAHPEYYADYGHFTSGGARVLTRWLVGPVAATLEKNPR